MTILFATGGICYFSTSPICTIVLKAISPEAAIPMLLPGATILRLNPLSVLALAPGIRGNERERDRPVPRRDPSGPELAVTHQGVDRLSTEGTAGQKKNELDSEERPALHVSFFPAEVSLLFFIILYLGILPYTNPLVHSYALPCLLI